MIEVEIEDAELLRVLRRVMSSVQRPRPLLVAIGELLVDSTKQRFITSTSPDGSRWASNSPTTILEYLMKMSGTYDKTGKRTGTKSGFFWAKTENKGRATQKSAAILANKKPLIGEGRALSTRIDYQATDDSVAVGSPEIQAAMMHFGGKKSEFPNLWGDIPARPFLGLSDSDTNGILDAAADFLSR